MKSNWLQSFNIEILLNFLVVYIQGQEKNASLWIHGKWQPKLLYIWYGSSTKHRFGLVVNDINILLTLKIPCIITFLLEGSTKYTSWKLVSFSLTNCVFTFCKYLWKFLIIRKLAIIYEIFFINNFILFMKIGHK